MLVGGDSVQETVDAPRDLKERYEVQHGVWLLDRAPIAAASMSNRYLS